MTVIWELDFYSRPVLGENEKKLWEVLICESALGVQRSMDSLFQYSKFFLNTEVNSASLRESIEEAIAQAPKPPDKIRFFRRQMNNMILKAAEEAGVPAYPSRRTIALNRWINQRMEEVYPAMPNYKASGNPSVSMGMPVPQPLPDQLIGQKWAFVNLEASAFQDLPEWSIAFGESFSLELVDLAPDTPVPGLLIFSPRALPMAAWMSGLEMAAVKYLPGDPDQLLLETGSNDAWVLAALGTDSLKQEAEAFEAAKQAANQVHFVGVQANPESEEFAGFWLLQELNLA